MAEDEGTHQHSEEELRYLSQAYGERYTVLTEEIRNLVSTMESLNNSKKTLIEFDSVKGRKLLTPISSIMQISTIAENTEKVLVSVGGGYAIEKTTAEAEKFLDSVMEEKNKQLNTLSREKDSVESILMELSYALSGV